jgi:hypothetical protein
LAGHGEPLLACLRALVPWLLGLVLTIVVVAVLLAWLR